VVIDLPSFITGLAAGLCLAAIFAWARRPAGAALDRVPPRPPRSAPPLDPALDRDIDDLLSRGQKIEAIKLLREATGCGLKEAKDRVEALERARG
jgi:hypothetical protein